MVKDDWDEDEGPDSMDDDNDGQGPGSRKYTLEDLRQVYHLNSKEAAAALGCAHSKLKRLCRHFRISRWPHRKLSSLEHLRDTIQQEERMPDQQKQAALQLISLEWDRVMADPDHPLDTRLDDMRRSNYKLKHYHKSKQHRHGTNVRIPQSLMAEHFDGLPVPATTSAAMDCQHQQQQEGAGAAKLTAGCPATAGSGGSAPSASLGGAPTQGEAHSWSTSAPSLSGAIAARLRMQDGHTASAAGTGSGAASSHQRAARRSSGSGVNPLSVAAGKVLKQYASAIAPVRRSSLSGVAAAMSEDGTGTASPGVAPTGFVNERLRKVALQPHRLSVDGVRVTTGQRLCVSQPNASAGAPALSIDTSHLAVGTSQGRGVGTGSRARAQLLHTADVLEAQLKEEMQSMELAMLMASMGNGQMVLPFSWPHQGVQVMNELNVGLALRDSSLQGGIRRSAPGTLGPQGWQHAEQQAPQQQQAELVVPVTTASPPAYLDELQCALRPPLPYAPQPSGSAPGYAAARAGSASCSGTTGTARSSELGMCCEAADGADINLLLELGTGPSVILWQQKIEELTTEHHRQQRAVLAQGSAAAAYGQGGLGILDRFACSSLLPQQQQPQHTMPGSHAWQQCGTGPMQEAPFQLAEFADCFQGVSEHHILALQAVLEHPQSFLDSMNQQHAHTRHESAPPQIGAAAHVYASPMLQHAQHLLRQQQQEEQSAAAARYVVPPSGGQLTACSLPYGDMLNAMESAMHASQAHADGNAEWMHNYVQEQHHQQQQQQRAGAGAVYCNGGMAMGAAPVSKAIPTARAIVSAPQMAAVQPHLQQHHQHAGGYHPVKPEQQGADGSTANAIWGAMQGNTLRPMQASSSMQHGIQESSGLSAQLKRSMAVLQQLEEQVGSTQNGYAGLMAMDLDLGPPHGGHGGGMLSQLGQAAGISGSDAAMPFVPGVPLARLDTRLPSLGSLLGEYAAAEAARRPQPMRSGLGLGLGNASEMDDTDLSWLVTLDRIAQAGHTD